MAGVLLFPTDPLRPRRPDEHFADEHAAARTLGHDVALVDLERLTAGEATAAVAAVRASGDNAVYRGWMLTAEQYAAMASALAERDVRLRTGPEQYRRAHELPGWYEALSDLTPESRWTTGDARDEFDRVRREFDGGPGVLRDWVKSAKHAWDTAAFVPDLADGERAWAVATRLREVRDDAFTGGFVIRRFEQFVGAEARTWWVRGRCVSVTPHPDTPADLPEGVDAALLDLVVGPGVRATGLPFVTVDLVRHADGRWRVVELGDGQVSDRPATVDAEEFIRRTTPRPSADFRT